MNTQRRPAREAIDGVLLLDKPVGLSSNAALQRAKRALNAAKAGHTGTLDPLASGLLPLCFGDATKFAQALLDAPKRYTATIRFGSTTATGDAEGEVLDTRPVHLTRAQVEAALPAFVGAIEQVPPAFAALKYQGRNYYEYARAGVEIPRAARRVEVHALTLLAWDSPDAVVDVACSKGTYVRVLAEDVGAALGTGAHLAALRRTMTGGFRIEDALTLDAFEALPPAERRRRLLPVDAPLADLQRVDLDADAALALLQGREVPVTAAEGRCRAYAPGGRFVGLGDCAMGRMRAVRLVATRSTADEAPADAADSGE